MPDISMCAGADCPKRESCYRHTARPSEWQSYFSVVPFDHDKNECQHFWDNSEYKDKNT